MWLDYWETAWNWSTILRKVIYSTFWRNNGTLPQVKLIIRKGLACPSLLTEFFWCLSVYLPCCLLFFRIRTKQICAYALQSVLEEIKCNEPQLNRLKEKAQQLWEEQAASKNFVHRVSQLSSLYLALSNLTKVMLL